MADRFNHLIEKELESRPADGRLERYAYAAALFFYDGQGDYRHIQHRLKYQGDIRIGQYFGVKTDFARSKNKKQKCEERDQSIERIVTALTAQAELLSEHVLYGIGYST